MFEEHRWVLASIKTLNRIARCRPRRLARSRAKMLTRLASAGFLTMIVAGLFLMIMAEPAAATLNYGPCTGAANGQSISLNSPSNPLIVRQHTNVHVAGVVTSTEEPTRTIISLKYFGKPFALKETPISKGRSWASSVPIDKYATYGVGSYEARLVVDYNTLDMEAGYLCEGILYFKVRGNPLSTLAGGVALGFEVAGLTGLAGAGVAAVNTRIPEGWDDFRGAGYPEARDDNAIALEQQAERATVEEQVRAEAEEKDRERKAQELVALLGNRVCATLLLPALFMMVGSGGGLPARSNAPRARGRLRLSFFGILGGLMAGLAMVVLLQQYGVIYATRNAGITGLVAGLAAGVLIPSLGRMRAVRKVNRKIDALLSR